MSWLVLYGRSTLCSYSVISILTVTLHRELKYYREALQYWVGVGRSWMSYKFLRMINKWQISTYCSLLIAYLYIWVIIGLCKLLIDGTTVYPKKYAHGFVVHCFVVVMQSFIMNSHEVFIHIHQGCFAGTGAIVRLPQCQWSKPDGYGKISQCITPTEHSKAKNRVHISWDIL